MIDMELALIIGLIIGGLVGIKLIDHLLLIIFHASFIQGDSYLGLYDRLDIQANFDMMKNQKKPPKTYAEYLSLHEKHRDNSVEDFKQLIKGAGKYTLVGYLATIAISIMFGVNWYWFVAGVVIAQLLHAVYRIFVREHGSGFYVTLMLLTILNKK